MNVNCCLMKLTENSENLWERDCIFKLQNKSRDVFLSGLPPKFTFLVFFLSGVGKMGRICGVYIIK